MTTAAAIKFEVGLLPCQMASVARLKRLSGFRRVAQMAARARNGPVFPASFLISPSDAAWHSAQPCFFGGSVLAGAAPEQSGNREIPAVSTNITIRLPLFPALIFPLS